MPEQRQPAVVRLERICKSFGEVHANRDITLEIEKGRIKALLGENGAGKSTLMGVLAGRLAPDSGRVWIDGKVAEFTTPKGAIAAGIGMVYQHFMLIDAMTVAENVFLGQEKEFWIHPDRREQRVSELAQAYGLKIDPGARIADLSMGEKQRVEILKLLQRDSRILIFDEPTAVLTPQETEQLFDAFRRMASQEKAIVFISHKLEEVLAVSDDIAILRKGAIIDQTETSAVSSKADLAQRMVGREVLLQIEKQPVEFLQRVLRLEKLRGQNIDGISLELRQGEILAIVGVAGNGQMELAETICGLRPPQSGECRLLGLPWHDFYRRSHSGVRYSYIPEDRRGLATCTTLDLTDNFLLTTRDRFKNGPWLIKEPARRKLVDLIAAFSISPPNPKVRAGQLSGGNLQKLVLAREFFRGPRLIIAEQPTQGLDIAAIEEVWQLLLKARERAGILLITGDLSEAFTLADRIAVIFEGRIMDLFEAEDRQKRERIGLLMAGLKEESMSTI